MSQNQNQVESLLQQLNDLQIRIAEQRTIIQQLETQHAERQHTEASNVTLNEEIAYTPADAVRIQCGIPDRRAAQCAFERFCGMKPCRQTSQNLLKILIPFLQDEKDTWQNSGLYCVALHRSRLVPKHPHEREEFLEYAQTRGGIWSITSKEPYCHSLREVLEIIDTFTVPQTIA